MIDHLALWRAARVPISEFQHTRYATDLHEASHAVAMIALGGSCGTLHDIANARTMGSCEWDVVAWALLSCDGINGVGALTVYAAGDAGKEIAGEQFREGNDPVLRLGLASMLEGPHLPDPRLPAYEGPSDGQNIETYAEKYSGDFSDSLLPATAKAQAMLDLTAKAKINATLLLLDHWEAVLALAALLWDQRLVNGDAAREVFDLMKNHHQLFRDQWLPSAKPKQAPIPFTPPTPRTKSRTPAKGPSIDERKEIIVDFLEGIVRGGGFSGLRSGIRL